MVMISIKLYADFFSSRRATISKVIFIYNCLPCLSCYMACRAI